MPNSMGLSRRERQIMDLVFQKGRATVREVHEALPDPPTVMAVRRLMHILVEKRQLRQKGEGKQIVYVPRVSKRKAGAEALRHVLDTFYGGAVEEALAAHLTGKENVSPEQLETIQALIDAARKEGR